MLSKTKLVFCYHTLIALFTLLPAFTIPCDLRFNWFTTKNLY